jgi:hypothetical protein
MAFLLEALQPQAHAMPFADLAPLHLLGRLQDARLYRLNPAQAGIL